jgi:hypothetical protein
LTEEHFDLFEIYPGRKRKKGEKPAVQITIITSGDDTGEEGTHKSVGR